MTKIGVYGTLRKKFGNWSWALNCEPLSTETVNIPFKMISLGGFPGLVPSKENHDIVIEIYEVDDHQYKAIERLEGYPRFYQKALISTSMGEIEVYVLNDKEYQNYPVVESGDWKEYKTKKVFI